MLGRELSVGSAILAFALAIGVLLTAAPIAGAVMCASSAQIRVVPSPIFDSEIDPLGPHFVCNSDAVFQGTPGGQSIDGVAHAAGLPGTTGPAGFNPPSAVAESDLAAIATQFTTLQSAASSQYWYEFMICPIATGCPSTPPPVPINIPVKAHYLWDLQATVTGAGTVAPLNVEHQIGFSDGSTIIRGILTQRLAATHLTLPAITAASVTGSCAESTMAIVGSSCAAARTEFFTKAGVTLPIQAGQLYTIKLIATAQADVSGGVGGASGSAHARAFIDPVIEIDPAFASEYEVVHADGVVVADSDGDGLTDSSDNCPFYASANQEDADGDGRGDECECTDQNGDGRNTVSDLVAINVAIFNPSLITPLCDGNNDGNCNVGDIVAANLEIFSPTNTSICARQPVAGP